MSPKKTSGAGEQPVGTDPSGDVSSDDTIDTAGETAEKATESYEDSLEAILLQAGVRPPVSTSADAQTAKALGSKTLMGFGLGSLGLTGRRADEETNASAADDDLEVTSTGEADDAVEAGAAKPPTEDTQVSTLLDEVAQALNVQASEFRDRARGKLPGLTAASQAPASAPPAAAAPMATLSAAAAAEFEDPDEPTVLTPGVAAIAASLERDSAHEGDNLDLAAARDSIDEDEAVVLGPAGSNKSPAAGTDGRSGRLPPIPGLSGPTTAGPVGPPPGASRSSTPTSGLSLPPSGRVRLPTPAPGLPSVPPPSGRLSLPPGMVSAPVIPGPQPSILGRERTATPTGLDGSRRGTGPLATTGAGRKGKRTTRITQPVIPGVPAMPAILAAHVKIATLSLAGLIAVTFAGGLLVGMLVWRGQARTEVRAAAEPTSPAPAAPPATAHVQIVPGSAAAAIAPAVVAPAVVAGAAAAPPATGARPNVAPAAGGTATMEAIVTPIAAEGGADAAAKAPPRRAVALRQPPRAKRPATTPTVADTAALFPNTPPPAAAKPAPSTAAKTVATNAPPKTAPKSKPKTAWHDPFAD